jgi:GDP-mannose transporter
MVVQSLGLMVFGSFLAAITDLSFDLVGYLWMAAHVLTQAAYVLYIRKVKQDIKLTEDQMVIYNNAISLPIFLVISMLNQEIVPAVNSENWQNNSFIFIFLASGIMGLLISLSTFLLMSVAGATTFAVVGALNKIPLTILGYIIFSNPIDLKNGVCVTIGLLAGLLYSKAKYDESKKKGGNPAHLGHK